MKNLLIVSFPSDLYTPYISMMDGFILPVEGLSERTKMTFQYGQIQHILKKFPEKEIFLYCNKMIFDKDYNCQLECANFIKDNKEQIKGVIFSDLSYLQVFKDFYIIDKLIYSPDTLVTNHLELNFYEKQGLMGSVISPVCSLDNAKKILGNATKETFYFGFSRIPMSHSRRKLLTLFEEYAHLNFQSSYDEKFSLREETRNANYPIYEDKEGTYIFRENFSSFLPYYEDFQSCSYCIIDPLFLTPKQAHLILKCYQAKKKYSIKELENLVQGIKIDTGFLDRNIIYRREK